MLAFIKTIFKTLKLDRIFGLLLFSSILIALPILSGLNSGNSESLSGTIILWHTWMDADANALENSIESFQIIYPDTRIIVSHYAEKEMFEKVLASTSLGFGPDIILGPQSLLQQFIDESLILPIPTEKINMVSYLDKALDSVLYQDEFYGLPISLYTNMLYFNKAEVASPIQSLNELTSAFESGQTFGMGSSYIDLIWGIATFGGDLFNEEGKSVLDQGALSSWLSWLQSQQELPQFYLEENLEVLRALFTEQSLSYFVDSSRQIPYLTTALGEAFGITSLPAGENGMAQPFLDSDIVYVSRSASEYQQNQAIEFGLFLGNQEQQRRLLREAKNVPVNNNVSIDKRFNPTIYVVNQQIEQSLVKSANERFDVLEHLAEIYFRQVIEGVLSAHLGAKNLSDSVNVTLGFDVEPSVGGPK